MERGSKVGIVCCSNGQQRSYRDKLQLLKTTLKQLGLIPVFSDYIYESVPVSGGRDRGRALMDFYRNSEIKAIFDISGGDIANEILSYLDFDVIAASNKLFWGYSDLTTIINAIYAKTGKASVLYQIRNLIYKDSERQIENFARTCFENKDALFNFDYQFIQGEQLCGTVVGGNIRCFLKLAGTEYWPDMDGKVLLLESLSGTVPQMITYLSQYKQIGVFDKIRGVILGTFTQMEGERCVPDIVSLVKQFAGTEMPIVKTAEIGHGTNSKGIVIGSRIDLHYSGHIKC